ncbi:MAG TPA: hypothetical protein VFU22_03545 [Roseiflexaceae bacterium]|nr:hypothetical protein [Roseiflexaceae bacterium]
MNTRPIIPDQQSQPPIEIEIIEACHSSQQRPRVALVPASAKPARFIHLAHDEYEIEPRADPKKYLSSARKR